MQKTSYTKGFSAKWLVIFIGLFLVIFLSVAVFATSHLTSKTRVPSEYEHPTVKETDIAPSVPKSDKTAIVVRHADSSYEKFLVPNATADVYIKSLPEGDVVISQTSPAN
ncbi:MAG TPA: hypothetical protein VLF89_07260 [Candidatus Saccharimonadales bacterium]|nr:hypothetical protein [Candidatus Saccharimonadales bacterium]